MKVLISGDPFVFGSQILILAAGIIYANWLNAWGNPRLIVEIVDETPTPELQTEGVVKHLYLKVTNKPYGPYWVRRQSANNCRGTITVKRRSGRAVIFRDMCLRWADNPIPLRLEPRGHEVEWVADESLARASKFATLPVDGSERFDVVMRFKESTLAIGWNHESYRFIEDRRNQPMYRIEEPGEYIVEVWLSSDEGIFPMQEFILSNSANFENVRLIERRG